MTSFNPAYLLNAAQPLCPYLLITPAEAGVSRCHKELLASICRCHENFWQVLARVRQVMECSPCM